MNKVLILFAHPRLEKSKTNQALLSGIAKIDGVTFNDLYEQYPDFNIDVDREKELLLANDVIIWHYPLYMYSAPAMLRQWTDLVLEYGWAHGGQGNALKDKIVFNVLTAGGARESYAAGQHNRFTIREFLVPFEQTAALCKMIYLPPFAVHGTHMLTRQQLAEQVALYHELLRRLISGEFSIESIRGYDYLNDWLLTGKG
ncbi:MAG: NAD(P)H oxidoreductase [Deltaproteobacteria bacterium HGW-Deltaproteobacteria-7]|jgi:glutathione-regulated potassium-efflux system ancillary protein KefG|nr:MAG: NAD(P)H oxidoreductase [Deltaproteobacteria bacterium HGW-Deltaproteobacteria-7]PKN18880.1 MAG: NAD(P)H oxidoreductase [Deltaproteobacteria bacterium HGW-Deltaproteobacteria-6]